MEHARIIVPKYDDYSESVKYFDDIPGMTPMELPVPAEPPNYDKVMNYGLPQAEQKWRTTEMPNTLKKLQYDFAVKEARKPKKERDPGGGHSALFKHMMINKRKYREEWKFIDEQYEKLNNGMWFMNNGKLIYLTGNNWFYLNEWYMSYDDGGFGHPDFMVCDQRYWIFQHNAIDDPNCCGITELDRRRSGKSYRAGCAMYYHVGFDYGKMGGIQSKTEVDAVEMFQEKIVESWKRLPFYFQCVFNNSSDPKAELTFNAPVIKGADAIAQMANALALDSWIKAKASGKSAFDGKKLHFYIGDEEGKTKIKEADIYDRAHTVKKCLQVGNKFIGFRIETTTVEDMEKDGGVNFKKQFDDSNYAKRNELDRTKSGNWAYFKEGFDGYVVNEYGESDKEEGKRLLDIERADYADNTEELIKIIRKNPYTPAEAFRIGGAGCPFNAITIHTRMNMLEHWKDATISGGFHWEHDKPGGISLGDEDKIFRKGNVIWEPEIGGTTNVSYLFADPQESNKVWQGDDGVLPGNADLFVGGADPFKFRITQQNKRSDGGGAMFMKWNPSVDPPGKNLREWETHRFVVDYSARTRTPEIYAEDMLKMSIYYGAPMFPEIVVPLIWDYFIERGYGGFLLYRTDPKTGKFLKTPGANSHEEVKEAIFQAFTTYIQRHGMRERHYKILEQCLEIEEPSRMTDFDLFTAAGYALLGNKKPMLPEKKEPVNLTNYHPVYKIGNDGRSMRVV